MEILPILYSGCMHQICRSIDYRKLLSNVRERKTEQSRPRTAFHIFILEIGGKYGIITAVIFRDMKKKFASPLCKTGNIR